MSESNQQNSSLEAHHPRKRTREESSSPQDEDMKDDDHNPQKQMRSHAARPPARPLDILYEDTSFSGIESTDLHSYLQSSVMDVFIDVTGTDRTGKRGESRATYVPHSRPEPFVLGKDFTVSRLTSPGMYIWSHHIQKMLRRVVKYYPSQILAGQRVFICHPYPVLHHHYGEIADIVEEYEKKARESSSETIEQHDLPPEAFEASSIAEPDDVQTLNYHAVAHDTRVLLNFLTPDHQSIVQPEMQRYAREVATFQMLRLLLKPGVDAYARPRFGRTLAGYVIESAELKREGMAENMSADSWWAVRAWYLVYVGKHIFRQVENFNIEDFKGEKEITSLDIFPSIYQDRKDYQKLLNTLVNRGQRYFEAIRNSPAHMMYSGYTFDSNTKTKYHGEVIIDPINYNGLDSHRITYDSDDEDGDEEEAVDGNLGEEEESSDWGGPDVLSSYHNIDPRKHLELTTHHYFLFTRQIMGFALKEKQWSMYPLSNNAVSLDIECVSKLVWLENPDDAMSHLVLPRRDLEIVKALSRKHNKGKVSIWGADFIHGKGEGQVFLLHAKVPRELVKPSPLNELQNTHADLCWRLQLPTLEPLNHKQKRIFRNGSHLRLNGGAVLLLDEADVFLERRRTSDLARNSMVSVFLRTMEYYTGILFLTTNRIGQIDDAFLSRVQVALGYEKLDNHARELIWYGFFEKLKKYRKDIIITERAKRFVTNDKVLKAMKWNGREIRNALQTAISLAQYDADTTKMDGDKPSMIEVTADHLEQVVERKKVFVDYTNSIRRETEEQRALGEGNRRDRDLR